MMITILMMMMITKNFPGEKDIDLALIDDAETFCNGFENSYNAIFVQGCHIPRVPRAPGQTGNPRNSGTDSVPYSYQRLVGNFRFVIRYAN